MGMLGWPGLRNTFSHSEFLVWDVNLSGRCIKEASQEPAEEVPDWRVRQPSLMDRGITPGLLSQGSL